MSEKELPDVALTPPASPCTGVCRLDPTSGLCRGCLRTAPEIARWPNLSPAAQWDLLFVLDRRRAAAHPALLWQLARKNSREK